MTEIPQTNIEEEYPDLINLTGILNALRLNRGFIFSVSLFCAFLTAAYAYSLDNVYTAKSDIVFGMTFSQSQGEGLDLLASFAGQRGAASKGDKNRYALERLMSRSFFSMLYEDDNFLKDLMAFDQHDPVTKINTYDPEIYNSETNQWVDKPSLILSHQIFVSSHLIVEQDRESQVISISILHESPYIARDWVFLVVKTINESIRAMDLSKAQASYSYLINQIQASPLVELNKAFALMIERELNTIMLADLTQEYIFETLDPAVVPELKSYPSRTFMTLYGLIISGLLSCILAIILFFNNRSIALSWMPPKLKISSSVLEPVG